MRDEGRGGCLRVLGLAPGASAQEIKAAYRDLAKVWHPDRFAHDPRLQQKAQEQLKEINEAYGRLASGDFAPPRARRDPRASHEPHRPRAAQTPPRAATPDAAHEGPREERAAASATADERVATRTHRRVSRVAIAAPALAFCATFAFITPRLLSTGGAPGGPGGAPAVNSPARDGHDESARQPADPVAETAEASDSRAQQKTQTTNRQHAVSSGDSAATVAAAPQPVRAMPTVTVSIDPTTGLRARAGCPHKSAMTFPAGDEPSAYCDAAHNAAPPQRLAADDGRAGKTAKADESRLKSFAGRITSPAKKLFGKQPAADRKSDAGDASPQD